MMKIAGFCKVPMIFEDGVRTASLTIEDGEIISLDDVQNGVSLKEGLFLCPGFIDEHIHGCVGKDVMDGDASSLHEISKALLQEGVTAFLPTTMTAALPRLEKALSSIEFFEDGARVLGVHLEGPFISPKKKGAQKEEDIMKPDIKAYHHLQSLCGNKIRLMTFAPESAGANELIVEAKKDHVTMSVGHSDATYDQAMHAFDMGASCVTHLFNAQSGQNHHCPGVLEAALVSDAYTEIICDLHHVSAASIKVALKCKKKDRIVLISDSTEAKYAEDRTDLNLGGQPIHVDGGVAKLADGTTAGSILRINQALANIASLAEDYSISDLVNLASINPARNLGMDADYGSIKVGKHADFTVIDKDFNVYATIVGGVVLYQKGDWLHGRN